MASLSSEIAKHLPFLRRYARALTGSQERGDRYIRLCLETLVEEPSRIPSDVSVRVQLFGLFHDVWTTVDNVAPEVEDSTGEQEAQVKERLAALPPRERQVLLLVSLEGFSIEDTGYILNLDEAEVRRLLDMAREDLKKQTTTTVLIIEDEPIIALDIADIVKGMGHTVVGMASRKDEAIALAKDKTPGLVLADIQLEDGSTGIAAVQEILRSVSAPVIFVTAYPERLLTGEALEPAFLVTKPFDPDTLRAAVSQALFFRHPDQVENGRA